MEVKRKPKGSEGGSLQIRELDADTLNKLQELQKFFGVGTSSKAVLLAVKNFVHYKEEIQSLRLQLQDANRTVEEQAKMLMQVGCVVDTFRRNKTDYY